MNLNDETSIEGEGIDSTPKKVIKRRKPTSSFNIIDMKVETSYNSKNDEDFLNKSLNVLDEIEGIFKANITSINELTNGTLSYTFQLQAYDAKYSMKAYFKPVLLRRSSLYRLANALNILKEDDIKPFMFLNKEVWVSVKTNTVDGKVYENIVDYASIEYEYNELSINDKGYFIFDD